MNATSRVLCKIVAFALATGVADAGARTISWAGRTWVVRNARVTKVGPGPNYFSDSTNNVWVDAGGALHLKITKVGAKWHCADIYLNQSLGYGTYSWDVQTPINAIDPNAVFGLFTYQDDTHEIDIEASRWSDPNATYNLHYSVQPSDIPGNYLGWSLGAGYSPSTHSFNWNAGGIDFLSVSGGTTLQSWSYTGASNPAPGTERTHLNLWLNQGWAPQDGQPVEVVITSFTYTP